MASEPNQKAVEQFVAQFPMAATVAPFQAINGNPVHGGFAASWWDAKRNVGFTVAVHNNGQMKCFLEITGTAADAVAAGKCIADAMSAYRS
jgi:hypothetical protein